MQKIGEEDREVTLCNAYLIEEVILRFLKTVTYVSA